MLVDEMKRRITAALKAGNTVEKEILRVALKQPIAVGAEGGTKPMTVSAT